MKDGLMAWLKRRVWVRALLMSAFASLAISGASYAVYQHWDVHLARQCALTNGYWVAHDQCLPRRDHCEHDGKFLALGERYYDGCNWWTCGPYLWKVTSKFCVR